MIVDGGGKNVTEPILVVSTNGDKAALAIIHGASSKQCEVKMFWHCDHRRRAMVL